MTSTPVVALVDDDEAVRLSTASLLARAGYSVRTFCDGEQFLQSGHAEGLQCALLDIRMPGIDGLSVMRELNHRRFPPSVVMLTGHGDIALAVEAMKLGAADFLEKPYDPQHLLEVLRRVCAGPVPTFPASRHDPVARAKIELLSKRQRAVLLGILKGQPNKVIAFELALSVRTVEAYRAQMLSKLGVRGTSQAVRIAVAAGVAED